MDEDFYCEQEDEIARLTPDIFCVRLKKGVMHVARTGDFLFLIRNPAEKIHHPYRIAGIQWGDRRMVTLSSQFSGPLDVEAQRAAFAGRMQAEEW